MKKMVFSLLVPLLLMSAVNSEANELIVYCGVTMVKPMTEIAVRFEARENCKVRVVKGGTGELIERIVTNKNGDLFLPGSDDYYAKLEKKQPGLIVGEKRFLGYNRAALLVQKGNPKKIPADLVALMNPAYDVIIGNPESGSIGQETEKILKARGIHEQVLKNAKAQTSESKALVNALMHKKADVTINWHAVASWPENADIVETLPIDEKYAKKEKLVLSLVRYSSNPEMARKFLEYAGSEEGLAIFAGLGFGK